MSISFRPHHFLCALCFRGKGYSPEFVKNFTEIMTQLNDVDGDDVVIQVVATTDSICNPCPNKRADNCTTQEKILRLDDAHAAILGIKPGDQLTWGQAKKLIKEKMTLQHFHQACSECNWKPLGVCEESLRKL